MGLPLRNVDMAELEQLASRESFYRMRGGLKLVKGAEQSEDTLYRLTDASELVMGVEKSCELFYQTIGNKRWSKELQELFQYLATQEAEHHSAFAGLVRSSQPGAATNGDWDTHEAGLRATFHNAVYGWPDETSGGLLKALSTVLFHGQAFGWPSNTLATAQKVKSEEQALRLAISFEKDMLLLLYNLSDIVTDSDQELLDRVIAEERMHVQLLTERL